jgi:nickel-type superoxide dismutase maturation protease
MAMFGAPFASGVFPWRPRPQLASVVDRHLTQGSPLRKKGRAGRTARWAVVVLGAAGAGVAAAFSRVSVSGDSMRPTLEPGDRLLVRRVGGRPRLGPGDLVTVPDPRPESGGRILVKRVGSVDGDTVALVGDNPHASTDSRSFGPVPVSSVLGRVVYRYGPPGRSGRPGGRRAPPVPLPE